MGDLGHLWKGTLQPANQVLKVGLVSIQAIPKVPSLNVKHLELLKRVKIKEILKKSERVQTLGMIDKVIKDTKKVGIEFINLDIMAGLPGQSVESFLKTLKYVVRLKPQKISVSPFRLTQMKIFFQQGNKLNKKDIFNRQVMYD